MSMGHMRLAPNSEVLVIPNGLTAGTYTYTLDSAEFPTEVVRATFTNDASLAVAGTNYFTLNILKYDATNAVARTIATTTTNTGGTALTQGVPQVLTLVNTADSTNYTQPTFQQSQLYRKLRAGDYLRVQVVVTGTGVAPTNGVVRLRTIESAQTSATA